MGKRFSTFLLDNILEQEKKEREELRLQLIEKLFKTFDKLSHEIPVKETIYSKLEERKQEKK